MNYEKKYKEALSRAKGMWEQGMMPERIEYIFPELKESEDERIRKELLEHCLNRKDGKQVCVDASDYRRWAGWLEKQGSEPNWYHHKVDLSNCSEEYRKAYYDGWNNCNMQHSQCKSEKQGEVKESVISQHENKTRKENDDSLTSENERIRKAIHIYLDWLDGRKDCAPRGEYSIRDMIAWLERLGTASFQEDVNEWSKTLLDLARKELQLEFEAKLDKAYKCADKVQYENGKKDAIKNIPTWKKASGYKEFDKHVILLERDNRVCLTEYVNDGEYYIVLDDLKTLPKEK